MKTTNSSLSAQHLSAGYGHKVVINDQTITIPAGQITGLIGPNGSGKSTLFNVLNGFEKPMAGDVYLGDHTVASFNAKQRAQHIACLVQHPEAPSGITVSELVTYGRYAHRRGLHRFGKADRQAVTDAIMAVHLTAFADQPVSDLSGGQRQRAFIAMTLAQDSPVMMLDEPTTYLDLTNQLEILTLLQELNAKFHKTIVIILHDLNQAAAYCQHLICLVHGQVQAAGCPRTVLTEKLLADVFQVRADIAYDQQLDCPQMLNCRPLAAIS
jgi:iron complex transport system ATP-binding protein